MLIRYYTTIKYVTEVFDLSDLKTFQGLGFEDLGNFATASDEELKKLLRLAINIPTLNFVKELRNI